MSDEYGLWLWNATGSLRFAIYGRYFRLHSRYTRPIVSSPNWSFTISIPGASGDGSWVAYIRGANASFAAWYSFTTDLLTVNVSSQAVTGTMYIEVLRG